MNCVLALSISRPKGGFTGVACSAPPPLAQGAPSLVEGRGWPFPPSSLLTNNSLATQTLDLIVVDLQFSQDRIRVLTQCRRRTAD